MEYTKYFAAINRQSGPPVFSGDQFSRMMNIIILENKIEALHALPVSQFNVDVYAYVMKETIGLKAKLRKLTQNKKPFELIDDMARKSYRQ